MEPRHNVLGFTIVAALLALAVAFWLGGDLGAKTTEPKPPVFTTPAPKPTG